MKIFADIESIPEQPEAEAKALIAETIQAPAAMKKAETIKDWHDGKGKYEGAKDRLIEETYRKGSFDGGKGEVISIAWSLEGDTVKNVYRPLQCDEGDMLRHFFKDVSDATRGGNAYFIGHNITFDLKFLYHRAVVLGINPQFKIPFDGRHGNDYFCTMKAWAGYRDTISQVNLCKALGFAGKPDDIDGSKVWDFVKAGKVERVAEYNKGDVETVIKMYKKLNFLG